MLTRCAAAAAGCASSGIPHRENEAPARRFLESDRSPAIQPFHQERTRVALPAVVDVEPPVSELRGNRACEVQLPVDVEIVEPAALLVEVHVDTGQLAGHGEVVAKVGASDAANR